MGKLFKAALGFAIALTLLHGNVPGLDSPVLQQMRSDIASERPKAQLKALFEQGASALGDRLAPQFGTSAPDRRAHRLHS